MNHLAFFLLLITCISPAFGQEFANTLVYQESNGSPEASLDAINWVAGHWRGEAFGGIADEVWTPALGGSMQFAFKLVADDKVVFYEVGAVIEVNNSLILKLKHFDEELHGWEEKDETVDFKLVKVTPGKVYFDGFTFEKISGDEINMYVVIGHQDGSQEEVKFNYHRY